ncbi:ABC transporter ATP-binding protein [Grimontia hollisae]|uniref:ABC transporter ATP-binding protein n=1 Tax=Grimontia hollisae TaxID=673 RepID=UPI000E07ADE7|nr:ABC transporter ATP-binding protein [Grimontia hollisae]STQ75194.1 Polysialic acid transport ATP-binding protein KpsT [Grimontia hollisae]
MIRLENLTKFYPSDLGDQYIFNGINFDIPTHSNVAILGKNGAGKSTLFRLLAKSEYPNKGRICTECNISWPVALATGVHPEMTGRENTRFIGRINGVLDLDDYERKVAEFSELDIKFDLPVKTYSSGMRPRLAFACSIAIHFDVYLIDEVTSVGDAGFRKKARQALLERSQKASVIMVSHNMGELREFCDSAVVIRDGSLEYYPLLEDGIKAYQAL